MKLKAPPVDSEWIESRFEFVENRVHDGLDSIFDAICWANRIDEQRNTKMYKGLEKEFPYLVPLFEKLLKDLKDAEIKEGIR